MNDLELKEILEKHLKGSAGIFLATIGKEEIMDLLIEVAKLSHNNAIRLASESATVIHKLYKSGESIPRVDEDSILKLLKP